MFFRQFKWVFASKHIICFFINTVDILGGFYIVSIPPASSFNKQISISNGMHLDHVSCLLEKLSGITDNEIEIKVL